MMLPPFEFLQATSVLYVCIAEVFIVWHFLARVSDVAFGMLETVQLSANFVTVFIRQWQAAANAHGLILQLIIGPLLCLSIQSRSLSTDLGRRSCSILLVPWMLYARIVEQNRGMENELIVVMQDRSLFPCKTNCLTLFLN